MESEPEWSGRGPQRIMAKVSNTPFIHDQIYPGANYIPDSMPGTGGNTKKKRQNACPLAIQSLTEKQVCK